LRLAVVLVGSSQRGVELRVHLLLLALLEHKEFMRFGFVHLLVPRVPDASKMQTKKTHSFGFLISYFIVNKIKREAIFVVCDV
jgi:hypothetical protein